MAFTRNYNGRAVDLGADFGRNINGAALLQGPPMVEGNNILRQPPQPFNLTLPPKIGDWFPVPDGTVRADIHFLSTDLWLDLPDGSSVALARDELEGDVGWSGLLSGHRMINNARVQLTANTRTALISLGLISGGESVRPTEPSTLDRITSTAKIGSSAIVLVALVVGAFYFFPRGAK